MKHNKMNRGLSLLLALVMVLAMVPANASAVQSGFTAAPSESGALTAVNPATTSTSGPMSLTESASKPAEVTQTGIVESTVLQSATEGELTKFEPQNSVNRAELEKLERYAAEDKVTFIVVTEDAPLLEKFSVSEIAAQSVSVNAHKATQ